MPPNLDMPRRQAARSLKSTSNAIERQLKDGPEQRTVVGPLVARLLEIGWNLRQIVFGHGEWRVPKSPSEATKRERQGTFVGFPVDIAVFDDPDNTGDPRHLLFIIECKQPTDTAGVSQLESYFVGEPHVQLGVWANNPTRVAKAAFIYRKTDGRILLKKQTVADLPRPGEAIKPEPQRLTFKDLIAPTKLLLKKTVEDLLDKVVANDPNVTRREEQLDQLCNYRKLHLCVDEQTGEVVAGELTSKRARDSSRVASLVGQIDSPISSARADTAYDAGGVYEAIENHSAHRSPRVLIPPRKGALLASGRASSRQRNRNIAAQARLGKRKWHTESGYSKRSKVETTFHRYKAIVGSAMRARGLAAQRVEARIGCKILNTMTALGMPDSEMIG